ncbi:MAG: acyl-CoA dehydrogenase family protein [Actinomycetota bacterium]|nr:acyl-CoA dehydrogenase family protein [Actinomycetota bacterium]
MKSGQNGSKTGLSTHLWVHHSSKGAVTSTYVRAYRIYTIFEGTSEIQRLIIARAISGVHIS